MNTNRVIGHRHINMNM